MKKILHYICFIIHAIISRQESTNYLKNYEVYFKKYLDESKNDKILKESDNRIKLQGINAEPILYIFKPAHEIARKERCEQCERYRCFGRYNSNYYVKTEDIDTLSNELIELMHVINDFNKDEDVNDDYTSLLNYEPSNGLKNKKTVARLFALGIVSSVLEWFLEPIATGVFKKVVNVVKENGAKLIPDKWKKGTQGGKGGKGEKGGKQQHGGKGRKEQHSGKGESNKKDKTENTSELSIGDIQININLDVFEDD